jgi:putative peptidoglycan lipid II flippase
MVVGVVGVAVYIVSALLLKPGLQILGLALANTIQNSVHGLILLALLFATIGGLWDRGIIRSVLSSLVAGAGMGLVAYLLSNWIRSAYGASGLIHQAGDALIPVLIGAGVYVALSILLRSRELRLVVSMLPGRAAR